jgi:hypothetical protein
MRIAFVLLVLGALAAPASAQVGPDAAARDALRWDGHERAADWISTGLVAVSLALPCVDNRTWRCVGNEGVQLGVGIAASELVKRTVHRTRPNRHDDKSFFSAHTMLACVGTIRSATWALCPAVGYLRVAADWHWSTDTMVGAGAGALLTTITWGR